MDSVEMDVIAEAVSRPSGVELKLLYVDDPSEELSKLGISKLTSLPLLCMLGFLLDMMLRRFTT